MLAWAALLPALKHVLPTSRLVRVMWSNGGGGAIEPETVIRLARSIARLRPMPFRDNCLERSLLAYRFLSMAGAEPRLMLGVKRTGKEVAGHAWITVGGDPVHDAPEALAEFTPVVEFGREGRQRPLA
jgi:hypothetical protein